jgi:putative transposase
MALYQRPDPSGQNGRSASHLGDASSHQRDPVLDRDRLPMANDAQSVKTTQGAGIRGYDAGKHVMGRKRHLLVDTLGLLLAVVVTAASVSEAAGAKLLLKRRGGACNKLRRIWVDGAYRGHLLEWVILHYRFLFQPVLRCDDQKGFVVLPRRWVVERTFAWITQCRRLGKDYETLPQSSEAMIYIAMTRLMIRRLAKR